MWVGADFPSVLELTFACGWYSLSKMNVWFESYLEKKVEKGRTKNISFVRLEGRGRAETEEIPRNHKRWITKCGRYTNTRKNKIKFSQACKLRHKDALKSRIYLERYESVYASVYLEMRLSDIIWYGMDCRQCNLARHLESTSCKQLFPVRAMACYLLLPNLSMSLDLLAPFKTELRMGWQECKQSTASRQARHAMWLWERRAWYCGSWTCRRVSSNDSQYEHSQTSCWYGMTISGMMMLEAHTVLQVASK